MGPGCVFPFTDENGVEYNACKFSEKEKKYWCATTDDYARDGLSSYCPGESPLYLTRPPQRPEKLRYLKITRLQCMRSKNVTKHFYLA